MHYRRLDSIGQIAAETWNGLADVASKNPYPFIRHEFLNALEAHGCASEEMGWRAHHLLMEDNAGIALAAAPLYLKQNSFGEFVFDWGWAEASHRLGRAYYPKLLCAVPFSPVTGPRLLSATAETRQLLAQAIRDETESLGLSSAHALFLNTGDVEAFRAAGYLLRRDCHYAWFNRGYSCFDDFLAPLTAERRKKIKRERRRVEEAGIRHEVLKGTELDEKLWRIVYNFYANTYHERGQLPYLTQDCLMELGQQMGDVMRIFMAYEGQRPVAAAISFAAGDTLYGRHWGCADQFHSLHFETCYYQGIDYCIREKLARYDAGAQGEHKLHRGFEPVTTWSAHWLTDRRLKLAVADFLQREGQQIDAYVADKSRPQKKVIWK